MGLTLQQLLELPSKEDLRSALLNALSGIGFTSRPAPAGFSSGSLGAVGTPIVDAALVINVVTTGNLGAAQVQVSADGGQTFTGTTTVPSDGKITITGTGVTLVFVNGPGADSFTAGDSFAIELVVSQFTPTSWQPGSTPLALVEADSEMGEDVYALINAVALGGFLSSSTGDWLTLLADQFFNTKRLQGVIARGAIHMTDAGGAGPFTISAGQLWVAASNGLLYSNESGFTLALSGTADPVFRAERVGQAYNVPNNTISTLVTALAGVTVGNPDPGSGTWLVTQGADVEPDALLSTRCSQKWPTIGTGPTADVYDLWARTASAEVTRTFVRPSLTVEGQVEVWLTGASGPVSGGAITAVSNYITTKLPLTNTLLVQNASVLAVTVTADMYIRAGFEIAAVAQATSNMTAYQQSIPIAGSAYFSQLEEALQSPSGVRDVAISAPATEADIVLGTSPPQVATFTLTLTPHTV